MASCSIARRSISGTTKPNESSGCSICRNSYPDSAIDVLCVADGHEAALLRRIVLGSGDGARSSGRLWTVVEIDPATGHFAAAGQPGALRVWAYRERPVYTFGGDELPGEVNADGLGEFLADREGFKAFWWRDEYFRE